MKRKNEETGSQCSLRLVHNGRRLVGTSAQLAYIRMHGGWDAFIRKTATDAIETFVETYQDRLGGFSKERPRLRVVGGVE